MNERINELFGQALDGHYCVDAIRKKYFKNK